jgi:hydrogenase nickel incorporation protein HypA/HybF
MHEMGIVQNIIEILEEQAKIHKATRISGIHLQFGALTAVLPTAVEFAFQILSKDTIAENARLSIEIIPLKIRCLECGKESVLQDYDPFCPECDSAMVNIIQGKHEMRVASIELED